jgi:hypothetical protein
MDHAGGGDIVLKVSRIKKRGRDAGEGIVTSPSLIASAGFFVRGSVGGGFWSGQRSDSW